MATGSRLMDSRNSTTGSSSVLSSKRASFTLKRDKCRCDSLWKSELHGLTQFISSKTKRERLFWFSILLVCFYFAIWNTIQMLNDYVENESTTLVTVRQVDRLQFPSIILCPKNADSIMLNELIKNVRSVIPNIDGITVRNLIRFSIAGFGFSSFEEAVKTWKNTTIETLSTLYETWKMNRSDEEMFRLIFEQYGYKCEQTFLECYQGGIQLNCCDIFSFTYVVLRGRCVRLGRLYQTDNEEADKLSISLGGIPSPLSIASSYQAELTVYVGDYQKDVWVTPRYYLSAYEWTRVRFRIRQKELLSTNINCRVPEADEGTATCALERWVKETVVEPFNCTFIYTKAYDNSVPICKPKTVIQNFQKLLLTPTSNFRCLPTCVHNETTVQMYSSPSIYGTNSTKVFMLEISFSEMQLEEYKEILQTTLPGFVSQIGGQGGLFLGASIITFVQFFISFFDYLRNKFQRLRHLLRQKYGW